MTINTYDINDDFLDQAEEELFEIILQQRQAFNQRWKAGIGYRKGLPLLRITGVSLSLLGMILCVYILILAPQWCPASFQGSLFLPVFAFFFVVFYCLPLFEPKLEQWLEAHMQQSCRKQAQRCIKGARQATPFVAEYEFKGNLLLYLRRQGLETHLVWSRKLKGVAIQGKLATLVFKNNRAIQPKVVILHEEPNPIKQCLQHAGINIIQHA